MTKNAMFCLLKSPCYFRIPAPLTTMTPMKNFLNVFNRNSEMSESTTEKPPMTMAGDSAALTVVELFQSQGCNSCPPSSDNVIALSSDPNLLVLTYQVTYWDHLGWKDTLGNSAFDARQWDYARGLNNSQVYTPQVM